MGKIETRGNYTTCQNCKYKFKLYTSDERSEFYNNKSSCPKCGEQYCNKPETERKLFVLQDYYFDNDKPEDYFIKLLEILLEYTKNLIKKFYSHYVSSDYELNYYASNVVSFLAEEYLSKEDYRVHSSFAGAIKDKIKQSVLGKNEKLTPGNSINWEFGDGKESYYLYEDPKKSYIAYIERIENTITLCKYLLQFIYGVEEYCSPHEDYKRLIAIRNYIIAGENCADKLFQENPDNLNPSKSYGRFAKYLYLQTMKILQKELKQLHFIDK